MNRIIIGSQYFFVCYDDFQPGDIDELEIVNTTEFKYMRQISGQGKCLFQMKRQACTQGYIDWALHSSVGMVVGKFLIPEFCEAIGFTVQDLPQLAPLIDKLDERHKYEEIIYNSYMQNGSFTLTDEQRDRAYQCYKMARI